MLFKIEKDFIKHNIVNKINNILFGAEGRAAIIYGEIASKMFTYNKDKYGIINGLSRIILSERINK